MKNLIEITTNRKRIRLSVLLTAVLGLFMIFYGKASGINAYYNSAVAMSIIAIGLAVLLEIRCEERMVYLFQGLLLLGASGFSFVIYQMSQNAPFVSPDEPITYFLNLCCCMAPFLGFYVLIGKMRPALIAGGLFNFLIAVVNYFVNTFRGTSFLYSDILSAGTAMDIVDSYVFSWSGTLTMMVLQLAALILWALKAQKLENRTLIRKIRLGVFTGLTVSVSMFMTLNSEKYYNAWWDQYYGYPYTFCINLKMMQIRMPEGYAVATVEDHINQVNRMAENDSEGIEGSRGGLISERIREEEGVSVGEKPEQPNIIAIMNESWGDLSVFGDFETTLPVMPFVDSLEENTIKGDLFVSVYGAGTCDSEYSFLTGNTTAFLPENARPYLLYVDEHSPNVVQTLNAQNYKTLALHPGARDAWNRDTVYQDMGFQEYYSIEYFEGAEVTRGAYVSDRSNYDKIIELYEQKGDQPLFAFDVTIQNHGGYNQEADDLEPVRILGHEGEYPLTEQYLSLMRKSDQDFEHLIRYFENVDEPTIVVMFGDHQGTVEPQFLEMLNGGKPMGNWSMEELQKKFMTPYVIWSNYPLEEGRDGPVSIQNLMSMVLDQTGVRQTPYSHYLSQMNQLLPVINHLGVMDNQGEWYGYDELNPYSEIISEYKQILYNNMFDQENRCETLFSLEDQRTPEQIKQASPEYSETFGLDAGGEIPEGLKVVAPAQAF